MIAIKSSITANATTNTFSEGGILLPNKANAPSANAMSVAIGIPIPACVGRSALNR